MNCKECNKATPDDKVLMCAICKLPTCHKCSKLLVTEIRSISLKSECRLKYHCQNCDENFVIISRADGKTSEDEMKNMLFDLLKVVREQNEKMCRMERSIQELINGNIDSTKMQANDNVKKAYANVAREPSIIIKPLKEQKSGDTIAEIKNKIDPSKIAVGIDGIKEIKNGGVAINCSNKKSVDTMKNKVMEELGDRYTVNTAHLRNPRIIVVGVEEKVLNMEDNDVIKGIITQNDLDAQEVNSFKIIKKINKRSSGNIIFEVQPSIMKKVIEMGHIHIGFRTCKVYEHFNIIRCFNCGCFGHMKAECKKEKVCIKCFSKHEEDQECVGGTVCVNCINMNKKVNLKLDIHHSIFDLSCPCYERIKQSICKKIKNCDQ